jgi:hypothetical protein
MQGHPAPRGGACDLPEQAPQAKAGLMDQCLHAATNSGEIVFGKEKI